LSTSYFGVRLSNLIKCLLTYILTADHLEEIASFTRWSHSDTPTLQVKPATPQRSTDTGLPSVSR